LEFRKEREKYIEQRDNTQHSTQTDIHAPGGIRTHSPSKWLQ